MATNKTEILVKDISTTGFAHKEVLQVDNHQLGVYTKSATTLKTNDASLNTKIDNLSGAGNNNIGEGSTKLQIYNYGRDVSAGNYKPMVVNSSGEQILALSAVDNAVLDTIATNTANINVNVGDVEVNVADLEALQTSTNTKLDTLEASLTSMEGKMDVDNVVYDNILSKITDQETHIGSIDTGIDVLEACCGSNKVNVNISSGGITGFATSANQSTLIGHMDGVEGKLDTLETSLTSMEGKMDVDNVVYDNILSKITDQETHIGSIDTGIDVLEACCGSNKVNVNISSGNISGFATSANQSTLIGHMDGVEGKLDTLETSLTSMEGKMDVDNVVYDNILSKITDQETHIGSIDTGIDVLEACCGSNKVNVNISSGNISGFATSANQATMIGHQDGVETLLTAMDGVLDNSLVKQTAILADTQSILSKMDVDNVVYDNQLTKLTEIDTAIDTIDSVLDASLVKQTNIETLITTLDGVQDNALTKLTEIDTAIDTIDSVLDASLVKQTNLETLITTLDGVQDNALTKLTEIDSVLDNILVQNTASEVHLSSMDALSRVNIATGSSILADDEAVPSGGEDCSKFSEICVMYSTSATHSGKQLTIQGATTSGGTYHNFAMMSRITLQPDNGTTDHLQYIWATGNSNTSPEYIPCVYPFIKVINQTDDDFADSDDIRVIGR